MPFQTPLLFKSPSMRSLRSGVNYIRHSMELKFTRFLFFRLFAISFTEFFCYSIPMEKSLNGIMALSISRFPFESRSGLELYVHNICFSFLTRKSSDKNTFCGSTLFNQKQHIYRFSNEPFFMLLFFVHCATIFNEVFFHIFYGHKSLEMFF